MSQIQTEVPSIVEIHDFSRPIINDTQKGAPSNDWTLALYDVNQTIQLINDPGFLKKFGLQKLCEKMSTAAEAYWSANAAAKQRLQNIGNTENVTEAQYQELQQITKSFTEANQHLAYFQDLLTAHKEFVSKSSNYNTLSLEMQGQPVCSPAHDSAIGIYQLNDSGYSQKFQNHANGALYYLQQELYNNLSESLNKLELVAKLERPPVSLAWLKIDINIQKLKFKFTHDFSFGWIKLLQAREHLYKARMGEIENCKKLLAQNKEALVFAKYDRSNQYLASMPDFTISPKTMPVKLLPQFHKDTKEFVKKVAVSEIDKYIGEFASRHSTLFNKTRFFIEQGSKVYARDHALVKGANEKRGGSAIELAQKYFVQNAVSTKNACEIGKEVVRANPGAYPQLSLQLNEIRSGPDYQTLVNLGRKELEKETNLAIDGFSFIVQSSISDETAYEVGRSIVGGNRNVYSQLSSLLNQDSLSLANRQAFIDLGRKELARFNAIVAGLKVSSKKIIITDASSSRDEINCQYHLTQSENTLLLRDDLKSKIRGFLKSGINGLSRIYSAEAQIADNIQANEARDLGKILEKLGYQALGTKILEENSDKSSQVLELGQGAAVARASKEWKSETEAKRLNALFDLKVKSEARFKLHSLLISLGRHFVEKKALNSADNNNNSINSLDNLQKRRVSYVNAMKQLYPGSLSEKDEKLLKALLENEIKKSHLGKAIVRDKEVVGYENLQNLFFLFPQIVHEYYKNLDVPNDATFIHYILKEQLHHTLSTYLSADYYFDFNLELADSEQHAKAYKQVKKINLYHKIFKAYFSKFYRDNGQTNQCRATAQLEFKKLFKIKTNEELSYRSREIYYHLKYLIQFDSDLMVVGKSCQDYIDGPYQGNNADYGKLICIIDKFYNMDKIPQMENASEEALPAPDLVLDYGKKHVKYLLGNHFAQCQNKSDEFLSLTILSRNKKGLYYSSSLDAHLQWELQQYIANTEIAWNPTAQKFIDKFGNEDNQEAYRVKGLKYHLELESLDDSRSFVLSLQKEVIHKLDGVGIRTRSAITEKNFLCVKGENDQPKRLAEVEALLDQHISGTLNFYNLHQLVDPFIPTRRYQTRFAHVKAILDSSHGSLVKVKNAKRLVDFLLKREQPTKTLAVVKEDDSPERKELFKTGIDKNSVISYGQLPINNEIFANFELQRENVQGIEKFFMDPNSLQETDPATLESVLRENLTLLAQNRRQEVLQYFTEHANHSSDWSLDVQILAHNTGVDEASKCYFLKGLSEVLNYKGENELAHIRDWCRVLTDPSYLGIDSAFIEKKEWTVQVQEAINAYLRVGKCTKAVFELVDTFGTISNRQFYWSQRVIQLFKDPGSSFWGGEFKFYTDELLPTKQNQNSPMGAANDTTNRPLVSKFFGENNIKADSELIQTVVQYIEKMYEAIVNTGSQRYIPDEADFERIQSFQAEKLLALLSTTSFLNCHSEAQLNSQSKLTAQEKYNEIVLVRSQRALIRSQCDQIKMTLIQEKPAPGQNDFGTIDDIVDKILKRNESIQSNNKSIEEAVGKSKVELQDQNNFNETSQSEIEKTILQTVHTAMISIARNYLDGQPQANVQANYTHWVGIKDKLSWNQKLENALINKNLLLDVTDWLSNTVEVFYGNALSSLNSIDSIRDFLLKKNDSDDVTKAIAKFLKNSERQVFNLFAGVSESPEKKLLKTDIEFLVNYAENCISFEKLWDEVLSNLKNHLEEVYSAMSSLQVALPVLKGFLRFAPQEAKERLKAHTQEALQKIGENPGDSAKSKEWLTECVNLFAGAKTFDDVSDGLFAQAIQGLTDLSATYQLLTDTIAPNFVKQDGSMSLSPERFDSIVDWGSATTKELLKQKFFEAQAQSENPFAENLCTNIAFLLDGGKISAVQWDPAIKNYNSYMSLSKKILQYYALSKYDHSSKKLIEDLRKGSKYRILFKNAEGNGFNYQDSTYDDFILGKELLDLSKEIPEMTQNLVAQLPEKSPELSKFLEIQEQYRTVNSIQFDKNFKSTIAKLLNPQSSEESSENFNTGNLGSPKRASQSPYSSANFNPQLSNENLPSPRYSSVRSDSGNLGSQSSRNLQNLQTPTAMLNLTRGLNSNDSLLRFVCVLLNVKDLTKKVGDVPKDLKDKDIFIKFSETLNDCPQIDEIRKKYISNSLNALFTELIPAQESSKTSSKTRLSMAEILKSLGELENEVLSIESWGGVVKSDQRLTSVVKEVVSVYVKNCKVNYDESSNNKLYQYLLRLIACSPEAKGDVLIGLYSLHDYYYPLAEKSSNAKDFSTKAIITTKIEKQIFDLVRGLDDKKSALHHFRKIQESNRQLILSSDASANKKNTSPTNSTMGLSTLFNTPKEALKEFRKDFAKEDAVRIYEALDIDIGIDTEKFVTHMGQPTQVNLAFMAKLVAIDAVKQIDVDSLSQFLYFSVFDDHTRDLFLEKCHIIEPVLKNSPDYREFARAFNRKLSDFNIAAQLDIETIKDRESLQTGLVGIADDLKKRGEEKISKLAGGLRASLTKANEEVVKTATNTVVLSVLKECELALGYCDEKVKSRLSKAIVDQCNTSFKDTQFADLIDPVSFEKTPYVMNKILLLIRNLSPLVKSLKFGVYSDSSKTGLLNKFFELTKKLKNEEAREFAKVFNFTAQNHCDQQILLADVTDVTSLNNALIGVVTCVADQRSKDLNNFADDIVDMLTQIKNSGIGSALKVEELHSYISSLQSKMVRECPKEQINDLVQMLRNKINANLSQAGSLSVLDEGVDTFDKLTETVVIFAEKNRQENKVITRILGSLDNFLEKLVGSVGIVSGNIDLLLSAYTSALEELDLSVERAKEFAAEINVLLSPLRSLEALNDRIDISKVISFENLKEVIKKFADTFSSKNIVTRAVKLNQFVQNYTPVKVGEKKEGLAGAKCINPQEEAKLKNTYNLLAPVEFHLQGNESIKKQLKMILDVKIVKEKVLAQLTQLINESNSFDDLQNRISQAVERVDTANLRIKSVSSVKAEVNTQLVQQVEDYKKLSVGNQIGNFIRDVISKISSQEESYQSLASKFSKLIKDSTDHSKNLRLESVEQKKSLIKLLHKQISQETVEIQFPANLVLGDSFESYFKILEACCIATSCARGCALTMEQKAAAQQNRFFYMLDSMGAQITSSNAVAVLSLFVNTYNKNVSEDNRLSDTVVASIVPDANNNNIQSADVAIALKQLMKVMQDKLEDALEVKASVAKPASNSDPNYGKFFGKSKVESKQRSSSMSDITKVSDAKDFSISSTIKR